MLILLKFNTLKQMIAIPLITNKAVISLQSVVCEPGIRIIGPLKSLISSKKMTAVNAFEVGIPSSLYHPLQKAA